MLKLVRIVSRAQSSAPGSDVTRWARTHVGVINESAKICSSVAITASIPLAPFPADILIHASASTSNGKFPCGASAPRTQHPRRIRFEDACVCSLSHVRVARIYVVSTTLLPREGFPPNYVPARLAARAVPRGDRAPTTPSRTVQPSKATECVHEWSRKVAGVTDRPDVFMLKWIRKREPAVAAVAGRDSATSETPPRCRRCRSKPVSDRCRWYRLMYRIRNRFPPLYKYGLTLKQLNDIMPFYFNCYCNQLDSGTVWD